jgi:pimeloyl-ACP methyl ester carboxylesterase
MVYYSGFSLQEDDAFFDEYLDDSNYVVAGFSYGAVRAFEFALKTDKRIDKVQLFSPAFFQTKSDRFIAMQLGAFSSDPESYLRLFIDNCFSPAINDDSVVIKKGKYEELKALLNYVWKKEKVEALFKKGVEIEVYLGVKDKIIDSRSAFEFFSKLVPTHLIKDAGHLLKIR